MGHGRGHERPDDTHHPPTRLLAPHQHGPGRGRGDEPGRVRQPAHRHRGRRMVQNPTAQTPHGHDPDPGTARGKAETTHGPGRPDGVGTVAPARADPRRLRRDLRRIRHLRGTRRRRREPRIARRGRPGKLPAMGRRHGGRPIAGQRRIQDGHGGPRPRGPGRMGTRRMETDPDPMHDLEPRPSPAQGDPPLARSPPQRDHPETGPLPLPQGMRRHRRP